MRKPFGLGCVSVATAAMLVAGCGTSYYSVREPLAGKTYYTKKINQMSGGAVQFKDARTGSTVTIQNSELKTITEQEFDVGRFTSEQVAPAALQPAQPAQPATVPAATK